MYFLLLYFLWDKMVPEMLLQHNCPTSHLAFKMNVLLESFSTPSTYAVIQQIVRKWVHSNLTRFSEVLTENVFNMLNSGMWILLHLKHWLAMCNIQIRNIALILQCQYSTQPYLCYILALWPMLYFPYSTDGNTIAIHKLSTLYSVLLN